MKQQKLNSINETIKIMGKEMAKLLFLTILIALPNLGKCQQNAEPLLYLYADELPEFGESDEDLNKYVYNNLKWPDLFDGSDIILISLTITYAGEVRDINIEKSLCKKCEDEIYKVFNNMPLWKPAVKNGKPIDVKIYLPIHFVLK